MNLPFKRPNIKLFTKAKRTDQYMQDLKSKTEKEVETKFLINKSSLKILQVVMFSQIFIPHKTLKAKSSMLTSTKAIWIRCLLFTPQNKIQKLMHNLKRKAMISFIC